MTDEGNRAAQLMAREYEATGQDSGDGRSLVASVGRQAMVARVLLIASMVEEL